MKNDEMHFSSVLAAETPQAWIDHATAEWGELLRDHANCEKKAASTALSLMFAYPEDRKLSLALARLAREEIRHFEQVERMMERLGVQFERRTPGRYANGLRRHVRTVEPQRKLDLMLCGALIEARSCERFARLAPYLHAPLADFYADLAQAEARHFQLYLDFAYVVAGADAALVLPRLRELAVAEAALITSPDVEFRFHSGVPAPQARGSSLSA